MKAQELVDYAKSLDCIHCGLCLRTCPTYQLTGAEPSSPRGRIYLMRAVAEGKLAPSDAAYRDEIDFCLVCRHCESVCPAGVRFGEMMETARAGVEATGRRTLASRIVRHVGFETVLRSRFWMSAAASALRFAQVTGLVRVLAPLLGDRGESLAAQPTVPPRSERRALERLTPARGELRGRVAVLEGCAMRELYGRVNRATVEVLASLGLESHVSPDHVCCGALHAHNGRLEGSRELARATIERFEALTGHGEPPLEVVVNSAGCGAHMKAYGHLLAGDPAWAERAARFASRVRDFSELVAARAPAGRKPELAGTEKLAYDDPCHLCHGQQVRAQPRTLLDLVAAARRVEMADAESCCGSAGIYSLLRPADSGAVFARKLASFDASGADVLVTANPGCQLQWETGLRRAGRRARVAHLAEILATAWR
jgi:glycolate oxidase iron-sulfur subunit